ncbi:bifunctional demethylmenaquinone methyltransferase/2-methoxy-6-polyprenyl-1,4-benzoquinol methylase UbiE [Campylobacter troglodytis]|uniref:bifunctional demethylmenaquinone methyltransferase/2-methoxy-6-polyprenyl-1,4-benzoquinol methylase UbiE n=1 Tax=Campylobacter troglodytis TaxID=654363 RepID=UPI00115B68A9|nr:bifunctional demethylmenaquinone methyltransferase/2-methoxy-6-polyprenyl-1,4-benzoquinol methylase UbiE [Campylobacter troglodytis]TQR60863.1 bifunctional demethylmenaquinone methyltransferase/2-methoxy-6-polyprenyl-1,4-benzoquinol methylase UbiE [Campylobacter troglodytis]
MQKQEQIVELFDQIAPTYDKLNRILSFGVDTSWRVAGIRGVLERMSAQSLDILDIACGTGDMLGLWTRLCAQFNKELQSLRGIDPSSAMLELAKQKFPQCEFIKAEAANLPIDNETADIISISYGLRNVIERQKALSEFFRVLKKGGFLLILEFTKREKGGLLKWCRDFYLSRILPKIGKFISKNQVAYEYLPSSIEGFLSKEELARELEEAGFFVVELKSFSLDISTAFIATKQ